MKKIIKSFGKIIKVLFILILISCIAFVGVTYHEYVELKTTYPIEDVKTNLKDHTKEYVDYEDIAPYLIDATVAIEDRRFFDRYGVDYIALGRAMLTNLIQMDLVQGGSTIEQQFIKIYYFKYERSLTKKLMEIFFIYDLDNYYSKEEIIEMYVNIINYGDGYVGIGAAAEGYFGKMASELDLNEASLLAGIPNSPANLQLSNHNPKTYDRQKKILKAMYETGKIDIVEFETIMDELAD